MSDGNNTDKSEHVDDYKLMVLKRDGIDKYTVTIYKMGHSDGREAAEKDLKHQYRRPWYWAPLSFLWGMILGGMGAGFTVLVIMLSLSETS